MLPVYLVTIEIGGDTDSHRFKSEIIFVDKLPGW
jgi:hypothetical protein